MSGIFGEHDEGVSMGAVSCRDKFTEVLMKNNGVECFGTTGDCALFDLELLFRKPVLPKKINSIALSMPHIKEHWPMAYQLALRLKEEFSCYVYLTFHGYHGKLSDHIDPEWTCEAIKVIDLSGSYRRLSFYKHVDVHVGFRLHGHIWFLRHRKPSLLIAEDGRGLSHLYTVKGLGYSAASKKVLKNADEIVEVDPKLIKEMREEAPSLQAVEMFKKEVKEGYPVTCRTLEEVDKLWVEKMKPFLESLP
ncbi:polysaccharide pyruvyl transferase family protein [Halobacillus salinarum]|uniref:Polysaccharide pyruvyl transferase family protein n=1 Tax=Halobacillus salinarum TaxID=2932257 RepID=A0ABY4EJ62_9BACI|nr:polysaccharide pyruvyl transferase family protein [Halobacillus salinarum]UOQ44131.1 polysaccharide pyruvyl transferase family protein [Halobacillus salinarum]